MSERHLGSGIPGWNHVEVLIQEPAKSQTVLGLILVNTPKDVVVSEKQLLLSTVCVRVCVCLHRNQETDSIARLSLQVALGGIDMTESLWRSLKVASCALRSVSHNPMTSDLG